MDLIEGKVSPEDVPKDPVDDDREAMMVMKEEWRDVYHQLRCASEFYACWDCPAARARNCAVEECEPRLMERVRASHHKDRS